MALTNFQPDFSKGRNFTRGDTSGKNTHLLFFHEEYIHQVSIRYLERTDGHTHGQAETNMLFQLFQSKEHKNGPINRVTALHAFCKANKEKSLNKNIFGCCFYTHIRSQDNTFE